MQNKPLYDTPYSKLPCYYNSTHRSNSVDTNNKIIVCDGSTACFNRPHWFTEIYNKGLHCASVTTVDNRHSLILI